MLLQKCEDEVLLPIYYQPFMFKSHQRPFSTHEKEALALLNVLEEFEACVGNTDKKLCQ